LIGGRCASGAARRLGRSLVGELAARWGGLDAQAVVPRDASTTTQALNQAIRSEPTGFGALSSSASAIVCSINTDDAHASSTYGGVNVHSVIQCRYETGGKAPVEALSVEVLRRTGATGRSRATPGIGAPRLRRTTTGTARATSYFPKDTSRVLEMSRTLADSARSTRTSATTRRLSNEVGGSLTK
jgi:hypothetical protein